MDDDFLKLFGIMANAMDPRNPGGNKNSISPNYDDPTELVRGLKFIPGEVTMARRAGERVLFYDSHCKNLICWYWQFEDGSRTYYWERNVYEQIKDLNACPECGNTHISGGHIEKGDL